MLERMYTMTTTTVDLGKVVGATGPQGPQGIQGPKGDTGPNVIATASKIGSVLCTANLASTGIHCKSNGEVVPHGLYSLEFNLQGETNNIDEVAKFTKTYSLSSTQWDAIASKNIYCVGMQMSYLDNSKYSYVESSSTGSNFLSTGCEFSFYSLAQVNKFFSTQISSFSNAKTVDVDVYMSNSNSRRRVIPAIRYKLRKAKAHNVRMLASSCIAAVHVVNAYLL